HHWVWKEAGVLHRDISINNIMFRRTSDGSVSGVLCDWDLSDTKDTRQRARYRTGTGPFMAVELMVSDTTPVHRYRFDLQSFYFLLCWF
ncbi:hypothetical protein K474DRAFT_1561329, partial [Panus rudis PR-1116 ss-1]